MHVVFIHGPPASGKYTIARELSSLTGLALFHNHLAVDTAASLFEFGSPGFRRLRAGIWREAFAAAAAAGKSFIFTFNPEATVERSLIDELVGSVQASDGTVLFVQLLCTRETILQRLGNANRKQFGKLVDRGLYEEIETQGGFDLPALPQAHMTLNTETVAPVAAAKQIAELLYTARHKKGRSSKAMR